MTTTEIFYFPLTVEPLLPVLQYKSCSYGQHTQPATLEFFAQTRNRRGKVRFGTYCRVCMQAYCQERNARRRREKREAA